MLAVLGGVAAWALLGIGFAYMVQPAVLWVSVDAHPCVG